MIQNLSSVFSLQNLVDTLSFDPRTNTLKLIYTFDTQLNNYQLWNLSNGQQGCASIVDCLWIDKAQFEVIVKHLGLAIIGICHLIPHNKEEKGGGQKFIETSQQIFSGFTVPNRDQMCTFVTSSENMIPESTSKRLKSESTKPDLFSFNYWKIDGSYPRRLWRLSRCITLMYYEPYWSYCYEFRDTLVDYLHNKFEGKQHTFQWANKLYDGEPFTQELFLERLYNCFREFYKQQANNIVHSTTIF